MATLTFDSQSDALAVGNVLHNAINHMVVKVSVAEDEMLGDHWTLRVWTRSRRLPPEVLTEVGERGYSLEFLGQNDNGYYVWLVDEPSTPGDD